MSTILNLICHLLVHFIVLYSSCLHNYKLTNKCSLTSCQISLLINHFQHHHFLVQLKFCNINPSLGICTFWSSQHSSPQKHGVQMYLATHQIVACKYILEHSDFWTPSEYNYNLCVCIQRYLFVASKFISEPTQSWISSLHTHSYSVNVQTYLNMAIMYLSKFS